MKKFILILFLISLAFFLSTSQVYAGFAGGGGAGSGLSSGLHLLTDQAEAELTAEIVVSANGKAIVIAADYAAMKVLTGWYTVTGDLDSDLQYLAGITPSANVKSIWNAADNAAIKTLLGYYTATTDLDAELQDIAGLTFADDKIILGTGAGTIATADCTVFAQSILDDADEATFKATVNLEAGTDFDPVVTWGTGLAFSTPTATFAPTELDDITWGASGGGSQTWTFDTGVGTDPSLIIADASFTFNKEIIATSMSTGGAATPSAIWRDSDAAGAAVADEYALHIEANMTTTTEDAEISDMNIYAYHGGAKSMVLEWDGSDEALIIGDSATGEDLKIDLETPTDNSATVSSNSGLTQIDFSAISLLTTGSLAGRPVITTAGTERVLTAAECSGGIVLVTAAIEVRLPDVCDSATGAFVMIVQADASEVVQIAVTDTAADHVFLNGVDLGVNYEIDSPGDAIEDNYICMWCREANEWHSMGRSGTWVTGGAAD